MNARSVSQTCAPALGLMLIAHTVLAGTTYYVKNGGNDNANGTSDAEAWETIDRVHDEFNAINPIGPGDSVLFKCGDKWDEQLVVSKSGDNEVTGGHITIGAYGSGDRPIIGYDLDLSNQTWTQYGSTDAYSIDMTSVIYMVNEHLPSSEFGEAAGYFRVYHQADDEDDCADTEGSFYWDNGSPAKLYIHAFDDSNPNSTVKEFYANTTGRVIDPQDEDDMLIRGAVRTNGQSYIHFQNIHAVNQAYGIGGKETDHIIIEDCRLSGNSNATRFGHRESDPESTYLEVRDSDIRYNAQGTTFGLCQHISVHDNVVAGHLYKIVGEDREGVAFFNCDDAEVYGNEFWDNHVGLVASNGEEVTDVSADFYFHHNYFHGIHERAIVCGGAGKFDDDVHVYHNLIWIGLELFEDPMNGPGAIPQGIWMMAPTVSTTEPMRVYNNTIHARHGLRMVSGSVHRKINLELKNNIFHECKWHILDHEDTIDENDPGHHVRDYNVYSAIDADPFHKIQWNGVTYDDWDDYRDEMGRNIEANSTVGDPGFVDPPDDASPADEGICDDTGVDPPGDVPFDPDTAKDIYGEDIGGSGNVSVGAAEAREVE